MPISFKQLASRVAEVREERFLSQSELAERLGVHASAVSRIESGDRKVSAYELAGLAEALEVEVGELLCRSAEEDAFTVALRAGDGGAELAEHLTWFKDVVDDYLSLRTLVK